METSHSISINYLNHTEKEIKGNEVSEDCGPWLVAGWVLLCGGFCVLFLVAHFGLETMQLN